MPQNILKINRADELVLNFDEPHRFSMCKLIYKHGKQETELMEDYLYIFIAEMLAHLHEIPVLEDGSISGKIGKWFEEYFYREAYRESHLSHISACESSLFIDCVNYGLFLYRYNESAWLEIDRFYYPYCRTVKKKDRMSPWNYYKKRKNFRVALSPVSDNELIEWEKALDKTQNEIEINYSKGLIW